MKTIIRNSVFETNSSSTHSITIAGENMAKVYDTMFPDSEGEITIVGIDDSYQFDKFNDPHTKASFLLTSILDVMQTILNFGNEQDPNYAYFEALYYRVIDVIKQHTGCETVDYIEPEQGLWGYKHKSFFEPFEDSEAIKNFIFNKNSWFFTGNDNDHEPIEHKEVPTYLEGGETLPVNYNYVFKCPQLGIELKLIKKPNDVTVEDIFEGYIDYYYPLYVDPQTGEIKRELNRYENEAKENFSYYHDVKVDFENGIVKVYDDYPYEELHNFMKSKSPLTLDELKEKYGDSYEKFMISNTRNLREQFNEMYYRVNEDFLTLTFSIEEI